MQKQLYARGRIALSGGASGLSDRSAVRQFQLFSRAGGPYGPAPDRQSFGDAGTPSQAAELPCYAGRNGADRRQFDPVRWCSCSAWRRCRCWRCSCWFRRSRRARTTTASPTSGRCSASRISGTSFPICRSSWSARWGCRYFRRDLSAGMFFLGVFLTGFSSSYYHWNRRTTPACSGTACRWRSRSWRSWPTSSRSASTPKWVRRCSGRWSRSASSACCCGCAPTTCGSTAGCSSFPAWCCRWCSGCSRRNTAAPGIGLPPRAGICSPRCWNTPTPRSIRRGHIMGGHALKHLAAAGACYAILRAFQTRQPIG